jgi:hypothetical protein
VQQLELLNPTPTSFMLCLNSYATERSLRDAFLHQSMVNLNEECAGLLD